MAWFQRNIRLLASAPAQLPNVCQQVRSVKKRFGLQYRYGSEPLYTDHKYLAAIENADENEREALSYKEFRFARLWETNSPLQDDKIEHYLRHMMNDGRRGLMYELLHKTLYEIKMAQYKRYLKKKKKAAEQAGEKKTAAQNKDTIEEEEEEEEEVELNPVLLFHKALENCRPYLITKKVRRGGAVYQVPFPLRASESDYYSMKWLNDTVKERPKRRVKHYHEELAWEIIEAAQGRGKVVKKRDDLHKLAQANKAYAHYRWG